MAIIKCKMCGGDLVLMEGSTVAQCEYCGSMQTVPSADSEKKLTLFARANRLRAACEFDKAAGIYEAIVADFPEEAEAYWGLVLCKYGIEYVDDPGSGKKVPTCHRSSFQSVLDDSDFEQALENADVQARKVYREEAKQIEAIRKGILEVSSKEEPYDIFICYKETDETGGRTLDSVLAQDIYDALTDKDYRVFFSRITLEDKLGVEYEPYIFAALNSAKIMLAVGTDYEYYQAVWVKNEWSRYLKLMAADKDKHLIPCFKNLSADDMPKEFAKLQGQDLGKIGAMQDLLRGIEKILPRQKQEVIQERVAVQQTTAAGPNVESLLKRGAQALEDGEWEKADGFYEQVLNSDAENAEAFIGKYLVQNRQPSLDRLQRARLSAVGQLARDTRPLEKDHSREADLVEQYKVGKYFKADDIRFILKSSFTYTTAVAAAKIKLNEQTTWLNGNKYLTRARSYAQGEVRVQIDRYVNGLLDAMKEKVEQEKRAEVDSIEHAKAQYASHLQNAENKIAARSKQADQERAEDYDRLCAFQEQAQRSEDYKGLIKGFAKLENYKDAPRRLAECTARLNKIEAQEEAEAKAAAEKQQKADRAKATAGILVIIGIIAAIVIFLVVLFTSIIPGNRYEEAAQLYEAGSYQEAFDAFRKCKNYEDSLDRANACAEAMRSAGDYQQAFDAFLKNKEHTNSLDGAYACADAMQNTGDLRNAALSFSALGDHSDANARCLAVWAQLAQRDTVAADEGGFAGITADGSLVIQPGTYAEFRNDYTSWSDLVSVAVQGNDHVIAVCADGTAKAVCDSSISCSICDGVAKWTNIVDVAAGENGVLGLKTDGTVEYLDTYGNGNSTIKKWDNLIEIAAYGKQFAGLKADGTVVIVGDNGDNQLEVDAWTDIVDIAVGTYHTVGLKSDGTVIVTGIDLWDLQEPNQWTGITDIACGQNSVFGIRQDGTVVAVGDWVPGQINDEWNNVVCFAASWTERIALRADGSVYTYGLDVENWPALKQP